MDAGNARVQSPLLILVKGIIDTGPNWPTQILAEPAVPYTPRPPYSQCQQLSIYG